MWVFLMCSRDGVWDLLIHSPIDTTGAMRSHAEPCGAEPQICLVGVVLALHLRGLWRPKLWAKANEVGKRPRKGKSDFPCNMFAWQNQRNYSPIRKSTHT